jgi:hypothetical protein
MRQAGEHLGIAKRPDGRLQREPHAAVSMRGEHLLNAQKERRP